MAAANGRLEAVRLFHAQNPLELALANRKFEIRSLLRDPPKEAEPVQLVDVSSRHISVSWTTPVSLGASVDQYEIRWQPSKESQGFMAHTEDWATILIDHPTTSWTFETLLPATDIDVDVRAHNVAGWVPGPA